VKTETYLNGRPTRLVVLDYGTFKVHSNGRIIGIVGYLIETDHGERVVIDTGFPAKYAYDMRRSTIEDSLESFGEVISLTPDNLPLPQLEKAGVAEQDVSLFITSHTHIDHVGGLDLFPAAPMIVAKVERDLPKPLYWHKAQPLDWPDREYLPIEEDTRIGPGFEILFVPGHAPGQLAFVIELPETGTVVLTSDAISRESEPEEGFAGSYDPPAAAANAERLLKLARERSAFVIYGHSPQQWKTLRKSPDDYR